MSLNNTIDEVIHSIMMGAVCIHKHKRQESIMLATSWCVGVADGAILCLFFHEHGLISITAYWMTVSHIPFNQLNVTSIGLGYYMILTFDLYPS
jgi:hypothetical protein